MGLLPCLRRGSDRWWLPCSLQATEVVAELILRSEQHRSLAGQPTSAQRLTAPRLTAETRRRVHRAILTDPPLMIYASLSSTADRVEPMQLVDWLADHILERIASGEAYLGQPAITAAIARRWNRLRDHFRTLPIQRWLEDAALWLEVTGPPVPATWKQQWPTTDPDDELLETVDASRQLDEPTPPFSMLQQLARTVQYQRSLETAFDRQLSESKRQALKQLAYGLSHEINNPLANISTRAQQLQRGEEDSSRAATLQRIVDQVYRAHEMIADLMFYAHPPAVQLVRTNLGELLTTAVESYHDELARQAIRMELNLPENQVETQVDRGMIGEAVSALIRNAIEAIGCQGTIVVSLEDHPDRFEIHVADSGPGVSPQARQHAFDPYYSGREAGRGLGLGLCRAYRIVELHRGEISLAGGPAGCVATIRLSKPGQSADES